MNSASRLELWTGGVSAPGSIARMARHAEDDGWDGIGLVDSQNLAPDPYVILGLAAEATSTLRLATAVTNPVTRHAAAAATAIATVQASSGGRAVLGIGRGDSSLAHLGLAPASPSVFEKYLSRLQRYLRGEDVPFESDSYRSLGMAGAPDASRLRWLAAYGSAGREKVPVDVAATGPKVIAIGARLAERVTIAVGVEPARVKWAIDLARSYGPAAVGAYVPVLVHPDRTVARRLISGGVASFARFSVMHGNVTGPIDATGRQTLEAVHDAYDMNSHFTHGSPQSGQLTDELTDAFGVAGPPSFCVERLQELVDLGLTKLFIMNGAIGVDRDALRESRRLFVTEVLPALCS
jgi:5,10-methylenetetrahydromethanopterin reductase